MAQKKLSCRKIIRYRWLYTLFLPALCSLLALLRVNSICDFGNGVNFLYYENFIFTSNSIATRPPEEII